MIQNITLLVNNSYLHIYNDYSLARSMLQMLKFPNDQIWFTLLSHILVFDITTYQRMTEGSQLSTCNLTLFQQLNLRWAFEFMY